MHDRTSSGSPLDRYPHYDVLAKWSGPSWNAKTRAVVARRLAIGPEPQFFSADEFETVAAIAARIVPQPASRPPVPIAALVDRKLRDGMSDGYRLAGMPQQKEAWRSGLRALDAEAHAAFGERFCRLADSDQDLLLRRAEAGELTAPEWGSMRCNDFFKHRLLHDVVLAYYSHPTAWSEIGWGGPASPRGYVRLDYNARDPWEAAEAKPGEESTAARANRHVR